MLKVNYKQLAAEFVIVFVGVAVALAADEWRQNFQEQRLETAFLNGVVVDLNIGIMQLEARIPTTMNAIRTSQTLADALSGDGESLSENDLVDYFVQSARTGFARAQMTHDSTYIELNSTGRLTLIQDQAIRQHISEYYRMVEVVMQETDGLPREPLNNYMTILAFSQFCYQGALSPACVGLSRKCNAESGIG